MIISCPKCKKNFDLNADLIPFDGRTIQCGACNYIWFFNKNTQNLTKDIVSKRVENTIDPGKLINRENDENSLIENITSVSNKKDPETTIYTSKTSFTFSKFLSYILVLIISFIGLIITLDTFKLLLFDYFPNLEYVLFSLFETLKDIKLFIKDLI